MTSASKGPAWLEIDRYVEAYEEARACGEPSAVARFLPELGHPDYADILCELVRVDLEHCAAGGECPPLEPYLRAYPHLAQNRKALGRVAFEHYRQCRAQGQDVQPEAYAARYDIDVTGWSTPDIGPEVVRNQPLSPLVRPSVARSEERVAEAVPEEDARTLLVPHKLRGIGRFVADLFSSGSADEQSRFTRSEPMPAVGELFLDFLLVAELGRGSFGSAYLARQLSLANRPVVLKVSTDLLGEPDLLAQLQHTNIMPVYSVHRAEKLQAVCMPYFGVTTLADVLAGIRGLEALPASGNQLLSTIEDRHRSTVVLTDPAAKPGACQDGPRPLESVVARRPLAPEAVEHLSAGFVEAILWLAARLADGLAHAHARKIHHRDLKPANILLSDEGQPMLLDFNLAEDELQRHRHPLSRQGGTLAYMAPECLEALSNSEAYSDSRGDIYSLGIVVCELLTGKHPFSVPVGTVSDVIPKMIAERSQPRQRIEAANRQVTPAVEAILDKCLEPDPAKRYQAASQLREDLERQLTHYPLRHARERSLGERLRKWRRRHPRLTSVTSVCAASLVLVVGLAIAAASLAGKLAVYKAQQGLSAFLDEKKRVEVLVSLRTESIEGAQGFLPAARRLLDQYSARDRTDWENTVPASRLPDEDLQVLKEEVGELAFALARAESRESGSRSRLDEALRLNDLAYRSFREERRPEAIHWQREDLLRLIRGEQPSSSTPRAPRTGRDAYLLASDLFQQGKYGDAFPLAELAAKREPQLYSARFLLGSCHLALAQDRQAEHAFDTCIALWPEFVWAHFNRGVARHRMGAHRLAEEDFGRVLAEMPHSVDARLSRAHVRLSQKDYSGAIDDLTRALEYGAPPVTTYSLRARVHTSAGNAAAARADLDAGLRHEPTDEQGWVARGLARLPGDPAGAISDFDRALALSPRSRSARQNKAYVLSEILKKSPEAIEVLDTVLRDYPEYLPSLGGRGVLLARLGRREAAHADARQCLRLSQRAETQYQVAGVFALTSAEMPADRLEAYRLLALAFSDRGYGLDLVDQDTDLDLIREQAEFRRIVSAARFLRQTAKSK